MNREQKPQPPVLLEEPDKSYRARRRASGHDLFDNRLIFGDLVALKALEQEFAGRIKCIYIDPPADNARGAFTHYDDRVEHSLWLRLIGKGSPCSAGYCGRRLHLRPDRQQRDGDLKVLMDELFGRRHFINDIVWKRRGGVQIPITV